ncbi:uncharacterized protein LOC104850185 [Fukomys damarensis]|uniref:uncharacterized protein LOC104850185 n=1 Tax=Fukomys damarensis TaxID=885580 RepID=UPI00053FBA9A|nr:uncharacterized protein LOC104850185 [Fukomys damarensis]
MGGEEWAKYSTSHQAKEIQTLPPSGRKARASPPGGPALPGREPGKDWRGSGLLVLSLERIYPTQQFIKRLNIAKEESLKGVKSAGCEQRGPGTSLVLGFPMRVERRSCVLLTFRHDQSGLQRSPGTCKGAPPLCRRAAPASSGLVIPPRSVPASLLRPPPLEPGAASPDLAPLLQALACRTGVARARKQLEVTPGGYACGRAERSRADRRTLRRPAERASGSR